MVFMKFIYSSYWGAWSRVLKNPGEKIIVPQHGIDTIDHLAVLINGSFIEVDLTPVNGFRKPNQNIECVRAINIRCHGTARNRKDKETKELPPEVLAAMENEFGKELCERLLTEDFLSQIDWRKYTHCNNGGCSLEKCLR